MAEGNRLRVAAGLLAATALAASAAPARAQMTCDPCIIGIALDGAWARNDEVHLGLEQGIGALVGPSFTVVFPAEKRRVADWTVAGARRVVDALLADPAVDLVLTSGPLVSSQVVGRGDLEKPVVATFVLDPEAQGFPLATTADGERVSGTPNLSYLTFSGDPSDELRRFRELAPFTRLTYVGHDELLAAVPLEAGLRRSAAELGIEVATVRLGGSVDAAIAAIPPDAEAVYLSPLRQLPPGDFDRLVGALRGRRLPTFSYLGRSEVDRGVLMSTYLDADFRRLGRRVALHVQSILRGEDAGTLPIDFRREQRLALNMATARAVGVHPGWRILNQAELLQDRRPAIARRLSLAAAAHEAVSANVDLAAFDRFVAAGRQAVQAARAALRPQVTASAGTAIPGRDPIARALGSEPSWLAVGGVGASQLLFSEAARANAQIQDHLQRSREQSYEEIRLEIARAAAVGYLDVLRAEAFERIHHENLTFARAHLNLAEARRRIGVARASEVVRWQSEIALRHRDVLRARAQSEVARIALNRLLNRPLEEPFEVADVDPDDPALLATPATLDAYAGNTAAFERFRAFMTAEGLAQSPEIRQLDAAVAAQERAVLAARRASWAPTVAARGDLTGGGYGAMVTPPGVTPPGGVTWTVGLSASLPLFDGGVRRAERTRAERELDKLCLDRRAAADGVEQRIRSSLHVAGASYLSIEFAADAARAASRNLEFAADGYRDGTAPMLVLLDAQHTALVARQIEANAVYDHLIDLMEVQRAVGRFGFFMAPPEIAAFTERLRDFFRAGRQPDGGPSVRDGGACR